MYYADQITRVEEIHHSHKEVGYYHINLNGHDVRMQNDTGSSMTIISTKVWRKIGSPALNTNPRWIEAYDGHRMQYLGHLECEIPWEKKVHRVDVGVIESEKEFGLIGRDVTQVDSVHSSSVTDVKFLPAVKGVKATIKLKPDAKPVFFVPGRFRLPWKPKSRLNWTNSRRKEL